MHIVWVCGVGMGYSQILKMTVDKALRELGATDHEIERACEKISVNTDLL